MHKPGISLFIIVKQMFDCVWKSQTDQVVYPVYGYVWL